MERNISEILLRMLKKRLISAFFSKSHHTAIQQLKNLSEIDAIEELARELGYSIYVCEEEDYVEVMMENEKGKLIGKFAIEKEDCNNEKIN